MIETYRLLARRVLDTVREDAESNSAKARRAARRFVDECGPLLELWCQAAGYDAASFREAIIRRMP